MMERDLGRARGFATDDADDEADVDLAVGGPAATARSATTARSAATGTFATAYAGRDRKQSVHLRLDREVFDFFKADGRGHISRMQAVLRAYVESQRREER